MSKEEIKLPYFDSIFGELASGNADVEAALGNHVHWGYWEDPQTANGTVEDFIEATENLTKLVCNAAQIESGMRILDVGCGFGGTIASLNERFSSLELVGINIDERQLTRAREKVLPVNNNKIEFIQGDACKLPFDTDSFDVVLAVECLFHFPSRSSFFQEAARVLHPQGKLALSDFILPPQGFLMSSFFNSSIYKFFTSDFGNMNFCTTADYTNLANMSGLKTISDQDITVATMPTYDALLNLPIKRYQGFMKSYQRIMISLPTYLLKSAQGSGRILYKVLAYQKE